MSCDVLLKHEMTLAVGVAAQKILQSAKCIGDNSAKPKLKDNWRKECCKN